MAYLGKYELKARDYFFFCRGGVNVGSVMRDRSWAKTGDCEKCREWKNCLGNGLHLQTDASSPPVRCNMRLLGGKC